MGAQKGISPASWRGRYDLASSAVNFVGANPHDFYTQSGASVDRETVTVNGDVYEVVLVATDSTLNTASFDNTNPVVTETLAGHTLEVGDVVAVGSELAKVSGVSGNDVTFTRGAFGTTIVSHTDGAAIDTPTATALTATATPVYVTATGAEEFLDNWLWVVNNGNKEYVLSKLSASLVAVVGRKFGPGTMTVDDSDMTNGAFTLGELTSGRSPTTGGVIVMERVPTADEVSAGSLSVALPSGLTISNADIAVRVTASGNAKAWDGTATVYNEEGIVVLDNGGSTDWAATDTVTISLWVVGSSIEALSAGR